MSEKNDDLVENYVDVSSEDAEFQSQILGVVQEIFQTEEGKVLIDKAYQLNDMQRIKIQGTIDGRSEAFVGEGRIVMSKSQLQTLKYYGESGQSFDVSLNRGIFHEFSHLADEKDLHHVYETQAEMMDFLRSVYESTLVDAVNERLGRDDMSFAEAGKFLGQTLVNGDSSLFEDVEQRMREIVCHEQRVIAQTNEFMNKYYNEVPRENHEVSSNGTAELEVHPALKPN